MAFKDQNVALQDIEEKLDELITFKRTVERIFTEEVAPLLEGMASNPMLKMLGAGKAPKLPGMGNDD